MHFSERVSTRRLWQAAKTVIECTTVYIICPSASGPHYSNLVAETWGVFATVLVEMSGIRTLIKANRKLRVNPNKNMDFFSSMLPKCHPTHLMIRSKIFY